MRNPDITKRSLLYCHRSTWVFLFLFTLLYLLIAYPTSISSDTGRLRFQGWPAVHLIQMEGRTADDTDRQEVEEIVRRQALQETLSEFPTVLWTHQLKPLHDAYASDRRKFWSQLENWTTPRTTAFYLWLPIGGLVNLSCIMLSSLLLGVAIEWCRRRKDHWHQITLLELGFVSTLVAIIAIWLTGEFHQATRMQRALDDYGTVALSGTARPAIRLTDETPPWLDRLSDYRIDSSTRTAWLSEGRGPDAPVGRLPLFARIDTIGLPDPIENPEAAYQLVKATNPKRLLLKHQKGNGEGLVTFLENLPNNQIEKLVFGCSATLETELASRFDHLKSLELVGHIAESHLPKKNGSLRKLVLRYNPDTQSVDEAFCDRLQSINGLQMLHLWCHKSLVRIAYSCPNSIRDLELKLITLEYADRPEIHLSKLPEMNQLTRFHLSVHRFGRAGELPKTGEIDLAGLDRFPALKRFTLELHNYVGPPIKLDKLGFDFKPHPSLEIIELSQIEIDEKTVQWLQSLENLKSLRLVGMPTPDYELLNSRLPHVDLEIRKY